MNALLSIRPKYAEAIMNGDKRYEFRKTIFRDKEIEKVFVYSTAPVKRIVGYFQIGGVIEDNPAHLWEEFSAMSGLNDAEFFAYFGDAERGFAIEIAGVKQFETALDPKKHIPGFVPPQSFCYLDSSVLVLPLPE
ncbi:MAG: ASCH domain-containing protein [Chloroflexi bacterium]|nr:ASCH domain-containing protein [Chloroflexota bacterium]